MAAFEWVRGATSFMFRMTLYDTSSLTGAFKTGLTNASTNLTIEMSRTLSTTKTTYTGANIETITTIGVFANPSVNTRIRFKETDITGVYEFQVHDTATNGGGQENLSNYVIIKVYESGTTALNLAPSAMLIALISVPAVISDVWDPTVCPTRILTAATNITSTSGTILLDGSGRVELDPAGMDLVLTESGITPSSALTNDATTQLAAVNARQALAFCAAILGGLITGADVNAPVFKALGKATTRATGTTAATGRTGATVVLPT